MNAIAGLAIWLTIAHVTSAGREAWDSPAYMYLGLPLMFAISAIGGYVCPNARFLTGIAIVLPQFLALLLTPPADISALAIIGGGGFSLFFAILCTMGGVFGSALRKNPSAP